MAIEQAFLLVCGALICGGIMGAFFGAWVANAGRIDNLRELYCTQLQLAEVKELNALLVERVQEYEARDAEKIVAED